jgi:hypothetical protein
MTAWANSLEKSSRRAVGGEVLHPDQCEKLLLHGAAFAVAPRPGGCGDMLVPAIRDGTVRLNVACGRAAGRLAELADDVARLAPVRETGVCETCGRPLGELVVDPERHLEYLRVLIEYGAALLRRQYALSDAQLARLFSARMDRLPEWVAQLTRHAMGLGAGQAA